MHLSLYSEQVLHGIFIVTCSTSLVSFYEGSMKQNKIYSIPSSSTSRHEPIHMPFSIGTAISWQIECPQGRNLPTIIQVWLWSCHLKVTRFKYLAIRKVWYAQDTKNKI